MLFRSVWVDSDADGVCDVHDNCFDRWNTAQEDSDADGIGDACDPDADGDLASAEFDPCPDMAPSPPALVHYDDDGDGVGNECDCVRGGAATASDYSTGWESYSSCRDLRERPGLEGHLAAVRALAEVYEDHGFTPPFDGPWSNLRGCLGRPCVLSLPDPGLRAQAEIYVLEALEVGYATGADLLAFASEHTSSDLYGFDLHNFVEWLVETRGEGLVRP